MKILLDENLPKKLKTAFDQSLEPFTVREQDWQGKKNGELLRLAIKAGFNVFITIDKNLHSQQNLANLDITVILLDAINNKIETLLPYIAEVNRLLRTSFPKGLTAVRV